MSFSETFQLELEKGPVPGLIHQEGAEVRESGGLAPSHPEEA